MLGPVISSICRLRVSVTSLAMKCATCASTTGWRPPRVTILCRQRTVLEGFQFRRDVALGVFQRLAAAVIVGDIFRLRAADLDVKAVHLVVLDLEGADA